MGEPLMENSPSKRKLCHEEIKAETLGCLQIKGWKKISQTSCKGQQYPHFMWYSLSLLLGHLPNF